WTSTSTTTTPDAAPVATPIFAAGLSRHHDSTRATSVVASWKPCSVSGRLPPGMAGNTGTPATANSRAATAADHCSVTRAITEAKASCAAITAPFPQGPAHQETEPAPAANLAPA